MRPLEQYATLRRGCTMLNQQAEYERKERVRQFRIVRQELAHWLGIRLVKWGYKLEQYAVSRKIAAS